jgi:spore cortex formation protein SpoVR/YcgB (stage V sporulation)
MTEEPTAGGELATVESIRMQREADQLGEPAEAASQLAKKLGLEPYPVNRTR